MARKLTEFTYPTLYKRTAKQGVQTWTISVHENSDGSATIRRVFGLQGGKLQTKNDLVKTGKNPGKKNATTPLQQAVLEAESEHSEKQRRKGYGTDVEGNESHAIRSVSPMLAKTYVRDVKPEKIDWDHAFAQPKYDGCRCLAERTENGVILKSRENLPIETMAHIQRELMDLLEVGQRLDGELFNPSLSLQQILSGVKRKQDLSEQIQYHVYDTPCVDGSFDQRLAFVNEVLKPKPDFIFTVETIVVEKEEELLEFHAECVDKGYEGAMLRHGDKGYEAGKRSTSLVKVKSSLDDEFKITGLKEGRGTYSGCAIFECVTKDGVTFEATAPGTLEEKRRLWQEGKANIGKMLTVKYFRYTDDGSPYCPVALRIRE